ncbi:Uncharacterised protein [Burkholderia pseudomallei]|nr:Uncharacterised protein [Burkholderia pseudomallei]
MNPPSRKLIPDELTIVVLDTCTVRELAYADAIPGWVSTFADMAKNGYSFSLADGALTELLAQYIRASIDETKLAVIVGAIETFLNPDLPVLLGKKDVMGMIGESDDPAWSPDETAAYSKAGWALLKSPSNLTKEQRMDIVAALQDERHAWIKAFAIFDAAHAAWLQSEPDGERKHPLKQHKHPALDVALKRLASFGRTQPPTLAERSDLQMRYTWRQWVRTRQDKHAYDPTNENNENDGIDFDLYRYLMLPALVVSEDKGFHSRIADIKSPQRGWFWRAQTLADAWTRGERPRPVWAADARDRSAVQPAG